MNKESKAFLKDRSKALPRAEQRKILAVYLETRLKYRKSIEEFMGVPLNHYDYNHLKNVIISEYGESWEENYGKTEEADTSQTSLRLTSEQENTFRDPEAG